ncbi:hypothetical protein BGZ61DRAFT_558847 [Ilyonectria robusta]|uniref:uncharacterized protein n=1 Tax=Ilyonectria robusta TaxID=1079257 RepID=UPI001E8EE448|nr:uncharacterized protein BGZ61DRAFT_558847 [Ilyonectria robusta]KAH8667310.1 hypothetical protein BGZ61DRAFT_558847 [Ilyonectria robusta]
MSLAHLDRAARQPAAMANDVERPRRARGGIVESSARTGVNPAAAIASTPVERPPLSAVGVPCFVGSVQDGVVREQVHTDTQGYFSTLDVCLAMCHLPSIVVQLILGTVVVGRQVRFSGGRLYLFMPWLQRQASPARHSAAWVAICTVSADGSPSPT